MSVISSVYYDNFSAFLDNHPQDPSHSTSNSNTNYAINQSNEKKRVLSTTQAPTTSSLPDLNKVVEGIYGNPAKSLPSTPTFPKDSPSETKPPCSISSSGGERSNKRSRGVSLNEEELEVKKDAPKGSAASPKRFRFTEEELVAKCKMIGDPNPEFTTAALTELKDLSQLTRPDVIAAIESLTPRNKTL